MPDLNSRLNSLRHTWHHRLWARRNCPVPTLTQETTMRITRSFPVVLLIIAACQGTPEADDAADAPAPATEPAPPATPEPAITADVKGEGVTGQAKVTPAADGFE